LERAGCSGMTAVFVVAIGGHHDDWQVGATPLDLAQQGQPEIPAMLMSDR
jgi:hypothetical protein